jgi:hypothetical protein
VALVTVPGPRSPGLSIGGPTDKVANGSSTIEVAVQNTGHIRLNPAIALALTEPAGAVVSQRSIQMDTFYGQTNSSVEFTLGVLLAPGRYSLALTLDDPALGARTGATRLLVVDAFAGSASAGVQSGGPTNAGPGTPGQTLPLAGYVLGAGLMVAFSVALAPCVRRQR